MREEYKNKVFRLSGPEGCSFKDMVVSGNSWVGKEDTLNFYVKVVGFKDKGADWKRSWGHRTLGDFVEKPIIKIKNHYLKVIVEPKPRNIFEKILSIFGLYVRRLK